MTDVRLICTALAIAFVSIAGMGEVRAQEEEMEFTIEETQTAPRAEKRRGKSSGSAKAVESFLGRFRFGMSRKQVFKQLERELKQRFEERRKATRDMYEQDQLRAKLKEEIERLRKNVVEFSGKRTGWDASVVDDQFAHKNNESMLVSWEPVGRVSQRRFFFFHKQKLYKIVFTLDVSTLNAEQQNYDTYKRLLVARFGPGRDDYGDLLWNIGDYRIQALNRTTFYGSFCLIIANRGMFVTLLKERKRNRAEPKQRGKSSLVKALIADDPDDEPSLNSKSNVLDNILDD